ncbi:hypothetical protein OG389_09150 [Streptomyces sp. NBC_00435]|uniref:hypothetical protein n=1 Tax=Streptomyces sp. NBC_00435 TaxID=2903649 RepID=UPI002E1CF725
MPLHTDSSPPAHFRVRVADHGRLTDPAHRPGLPDARTARRATATTTRASTTTTTIMTTENG